MISFVLPTHNRPESLHHALERLGGLGLQLPAEVIVIDNAGTAPLRLDRKLGNGWPVQVIRCPRNEGAAARNIGVEAARYPWIVMLDDDSYLLDDSIESVLREADDDVAAIGAEILLPDESHEAGGLPEVFIGCGVAIRREAFLEAGGYDHAFDYYAEEYDLCARFIFRGWRITHDFRFRVRHEKDQRGRDMNRILRRLVRNNAWVMQRYAPEPQRARLIGETIERYGRIAMREHAAAGYARGVGEMLETLGSQPRNPLNPDQFDRFTGLAHVSETLAGHSAIAEGTRIAIVERGKHSGIVEKALREIGAVIVEDERAAEVCVIGTLSPGPIIDAIRRRVEACRGNPPLAPWRVSGVSGVPADRMAHA